MTNNKTRYWIIACLIALILLVKPALAEEPAPKILIRADDIGMNHAVNTALRQVIDAGIPVSASVMVPCPWFDEAAKLLRDNPQVSVGIHLTLNSEWADYRWGPVLGASAVPSLVDENGRFFHTAAELFANEMQLDEVESELRAQIHRALQAGLQIDYFDYHMLTATQTPGLIAVVEKLAAEFGVGLSRYFGEPAVSLWAVEPDDKLDTLIDTLEQAGPGLPTVLVVHLGRDTPEMNALVDANNPEDPDRVAEHRSAELAALLSPQFKQAVENFGVVLVTYTALLEYPGLEAMVRPAEFGYSSTAGQ